MKLLDDPESVEWYSLLLLEPKTFVRNQTICNQVPRVLLKQFFQNKIK